MNKCFIVGVGRDAYGATAGAYDDLVIAVALAVWWKALGVRNAADVWMRRDADGADSRRA